jgi:hypothetical protein
MAAPGHGDPYTGTKPETADTAKGEPNAGRMEGGGVAAREGASGGSHRCVTVSSESEAP